MNRFRKLRGYALSIAVLGALALAGCTSPLGGGTTSTADTGTPTVVSIAPSESATGVAINSKMTATFSEAMDPVTIVAANFMLQSGGVAVPGKVTYDIPNKTAIFTPNANLASDTVYAATVRKVVQDVSGNQLAAFKSWSFTTAAPGLGPAPVSLGTSGNFALLAKSAVSTVPASVITGDVGVSPAAETYLTGFSQTDETGYATSPQVTGFLYAADMTAPTPSTMTTAVSDMETAYTDAAGRTTPDFANLGSGNIGGMTLTPGLYTWGTSVTIPSNITISGAAQDVWIFQIAGDLTEGNAVQVTLSGGAQAKNIFWQVAGLVSLGTTAHFEGIILSKTSITLNTGASMNGRALAQTNIALDHSTVTQPGQ